jgi:ppGpp synthetase/RelA/SpoT-type nucleotidyltranferase
MPLCDAQQLVRDGLAVVVSPEAIQLVFKITQVRSYVIKRDNNICQYCGRLGETLVFRTPKSQGGQFSPENCLVACRRCFILKNNLPHERFINKYPINVLNDIYDDIVDLSGIRVALYFPAERNEVDKIIRDQFLLLMEPKIFNGTTNPSYKKRFSGYWATHYRIQIKPSFQDELQNRYCEAKIEIQVASVLMHAWSEVEHDLVYKPSQGSISERENAILDEINGLVLTGEIALERLQKAIEERVAQSEREFTNHYELASYLVEETKRLLNSNIEPILGDVNILFQLIKRIKINSPEAISQYISRADANMEKRSLTQQIIDQIILADENRYNAYNSILGDEKLKNAIVTEDLTEAIGHFMSTWINFEVLLRNTIKKINPNYDEYKMRKRELLNLQVFTEKQAGDYEYLRRVRNNLVHGIEIPDTDYINSASNAIEVLSEVLVKKLI